MYRSPTLFRLCLVVRLRGLTCSTFLSPCFQQRGYRCYRLSQSFTTLPQPRRTIIGRTVTSELRTIGVATQSGDRNFSSGQMPGTKNPKYLTNEKRVLYGEKSKPETKKPKKYKKPLDPGKIGKGKTGKVVDIKKTMTVRELSTAMGVDEDHVYEAILLRKDADKFDLEPDTELREPVIIDIIKTSGMRYQYGRLREEKLRENKEAFKRPPADPSLLVSRSPVVTVMGHVDHGKTTLLDTLRKTSVAAGEAGGITQHIGAFSVKLPSGENITFLDTPGHAAFSAMRARGAHVTDIIVLVVAADDGVMKQTIESMHHAGDAKVPIIVAINKIDKSDADPDFTKRDLMGHGIHIEELGGDIQAVQISALQGTNVDVLTESIVAQAEMMELKADRTGLVEGTVLESKVDKGKGPVSTALIQRGVLKKGSVLVAGTAWAKVRGMFSELNQQISEAPPSTPVEIIGWKELPSAGEEILEVESEKRAREVVEWRKEERKLQKLMEEQEIIDQKAGEQKRAHTEKMLAKSRLHWREFRQLQDELRRKMQAEQKYESDEPQLNVVIKGDVDGSIEALLDVLDTYNSEQCKLQIIHCGVGMITAKDIEMAETFKGIVLGFHVDIHPQAKTLAKKKGVSVKVHKIIYKLLEDLKDELASQLPPTTEYSVVGEANLLKVFFVTERKKQVPVAGCRVTKGNLLKNEHYRIIRGRQEIFSGSLTSMKHLKDNVNSIAKGMECGLSFDDDDLDLRPGDVIQCCEVMEVPQKIEWDPGF
ncbi:translation initiation factor IF-2, mitochondrial-like [Ptychodera flava]|uniref:translation initiation factor IF-2, mitochondrial-like n=1 Tax=Ptychodera flava TaxID=63121 RepID=UPI003969EFA9